MFTVQGQLADPDGRFLFFKGSLFNMKCAFTNIYSPNREPNKFLKKILKKLRVFEEGKLFTAGDLNMRLDSRMNSSGDSFCLSRQSQNESKNLLLEHELVDIWRIRCPAFREYMYMDPTLG